MSGRPARAAVWAAVLLAFAGVVSVGRLAMEAWLERPVPKGLPRIGGTDGPARPLLVIVVDGLRETSLWDEPDTMPFLRALALEGAGGIARAGNPTLTAACVRTLLTGQWPDLRAGLNNFNARPVEGSWLEYLRERGAKPAHGGDAAIAQLCVLHLPPDDVLAFPDRGPVDQGQCDAEAVPFVLERIRAGRDLVTLHVTAPDHAGHKHGADGEPYRQACRTVDAQIAQVVGAFRSRHADATILVAADHGVSNHGTHGGGEPSAQRAPFVLVGPGVPRRGGVVVPQASLAPTLCALLGLPQPPLAQAPPATDLLALPVGDVLRALSAHVEARAWVARAVGSEAVDPIDRKRAELALKKMGPDGAAALRGMSADLDVLAHPTPGMSMALVLMIALLGVAALVASPGWMEGAGGTGSLAWGGALLLCLSLVPVYDAFPWTPWLVALTLGVVALVVLGRGQKRGLVPESVRAVVPLLALPPLLSAWNSLRDAEEAGAPLTYAAPLAAVGVLAAVGGMALWRARPLEAPPRPLGPSWGPSSRAVAHAIWIGALLGGLLSLRPLVNPFVPLNWVVHAATLLAFGYALRRLERAGASKALCRTVFVGTALLLVTPIVLFSGGNAWTQELPVRSLGLASAAALLLGVVALAAPRARLSRADRVPLATAAAAALLAWIGRWEWDAGGGWPAWARVLTAFGPQVLAITAFALAARDGVSRHGAYAARLLACLALARRLTASDAGLVALTVFAALAALAARLPLLTSQQGRHGWLGLAGLLLLLRTSVFYAVGDTESFSTIDVGAGFLGLEILDVAFLKAREGLTPHVVVATLQVMLRFALPWFVLFATLRAAGLTRAHLRATAAGLTFATGGRATALLLMLWAFDANAWWVEQAYTVYSLGAADLLLLLVAAVAVGAFGAPRLQRASPPPMIPACSA